MKSFKVNQEWWVSYLSGETDENKVRTLYVLGYDIQQALTGAKRILHKDAMIISIQIK